MKIALCFTLAVVACLAAAVDSVYSQASPQTGASSSRQWVSHQMNQPPPDLTERYRISDEMLDEIRDLYALAQKELETKKPSKSKDGK